MSLHLSRSPSTELWIDLLFRIPFVAVSARSPRGASPCWSIAGVFSGLLRFVLDFLARSEFYGFECRPSDILAEF